MYKYDAIDLSSYIKDKPLLDYLIKKVEALQIKSMHTTFDKENLVYTYSLISHDRNDDDLILTIKSLVEYNYVDLSNVNSSSSIVAKIAVDTITNEITDWNMNDMYDEAVFGQYNDNYSLSSSIDVDYIQDSIQEQYNDYYTNLFNFENVMSVEETSIQLPISEMRATTTLNKADIVSWARDNFDSYLPSSGDGITPYVDFSTIGSTTGEENYDCTNFVSHALLAGGATKNTSSISSTGWFFNSMSNRSTSWSGVPYLYSFLTRTTSTKGPKGTSLTYAPFQAPITNRPYVNGDILQLHNGSVWRHSTIITGYYFLNSSKIGALVTGRTSASAFNNNDKADEMPYGNKRVIKLTANYTS